MVVFIDTNVVLDFFLEDRPKDREDAADKIFSFVAEDANEAVIADITIINFAYIAAKAKMDIKNVKDCINMMLALMTVVSASSEILRKAAESDNQDYEDEVQIQCAKEMAVSYIITADPGGFKNSPITAISPIDFANLYC